MSKRSSSKRTPPDIGLHMECTEEELEPAQKAYYTKAENEFNEVQSKLDNYIKKMKAEVIERGENCVVLQVNATSPALPPTSVASAQVTTVTAGGKVTRQSVQTAQNFQPIVGQGIITQATSNSSGNTYLVMDPRLGLVVGQMPSSVNTEKSAPPSTTKQAPLTRGRLAAAPSTPVMMTTRTRSGVKKPVTSTPEPEPLPSAPMTRTRDKAKAQAQSTPAPPSVPSAAQQQVFAAGNTTPAATPGNYRIKINAKQQPAPSKPTENNALGGLSAGSKVAWKPNTDDGNKANAADSREVTFNKLSGKTFPSLVVVARPQLKLKNIPQSNITQERTALDAKVKGVLMYTPTKFTEWLIQQGLIRSEQICQTHVNNDLSPVKLKLGMYSDVSKFPFSGGYVWISECCPSQFVSVFSGSIFEGAPHPPTTLLKLVYHWACQTNVQNVVQWVKVDNLYVKNFFTNMRAVCTQAVHQKYQKIGGPRKKVEVGVISLGTTSQDGNMRQVKVEVLGVMDPESKMIRLRAVEPLSEERNFKRRFIKILEPLEEWVHKESTILTDFTVDKGTLNNMGFHTVYQVSITDPPSKYSNQNVMEYLRRIVPRMFQNTLSLLSRQIIQQFLDELVWREMWGPIPSQAFVNIIAHMAEQTKLDVVDNFLIRLNKVASNPFKNWNYSVWKPITASLSNTKALQTAPSAPPPDIPVVTRLSSTESTDSASSASKPAMRTRKRTAEQASLEITPPAKKPDKTPVAKPKKDEKAKSVEKPFLKQKDVPEISLSDELITHDNESKRICLDSYFYGTKNGDSDAVNDESKGPFSVKCCVCNKTFKDNIVLMKHIILHCQAEPVLKIDLKKVHQCEYCFLGFNSNNELETHLKTVHFKVNGNIEHNLDCQICEEKFITPADLIYHMHRNHVEMELPYDCGVCHFRSSVYKDLVGHFCAAHKGTGYVFCPFCLKVVSLTHKGKPMITNVMFYLSHLEKHHRKSLTKKCHRCQLSFVHKGILDQHLEADHSTFKEEFGVKPFPTTPDAILMPEPGNLVKPSLVPKQGKNARFKNAYVSTKFKALEIKGIEDDNACIECEGNLSRADHYVGVFNCLKCRYATCCEKAVMEHVAIFHDATPVQYTLGRPTVLPYEMFCVCGYSSSSGNRLARHIALCEKKSVYLTEEAAAAMAEVETKSTGRGRPKRQTGESQNMLNMLGLMRKSPETAEGAGNEADGDASAKKERVSSEAEETEKSDDGEMEEEVDEKMDVEVEKIGDASVPKAEETSVPNQGGDVDEPIAVEESASDKTTADGENIPTETANTSDSCEKKACENENNTNTDTEVQTIGEDKNSDLENVEKEEIESRQISNENIENNDKQNEQVTSEN